jgi:hypothetical protein
MSHKEGHTDNTPNWVYDLLEVGQQVFFPEKYGNVSDYIPQYALDQLTPEQLDLLQRSDVVQSNPLLNLIATGFNFSQLDNAPFSAAVHPLKPETVWVNENWDSWDINSQVETMAHEGLGHVLDFGGNLWGIGGASGGVEGTKEGYYGWDSSEGPMTEDNVRRVWGDDAADRIYSSFEQLRYFLANGTEAIGTAAQKFATGEELTPEEVKYFSQFTTNPAFTSDERDAFASAFVSNPSNSFGSTDVYRRNDAGEILLDQSTPVFRDPHDIAAEERARVRMTRAWDQLYQEFQTSTASAENAFRSKFEKPKKNFLNIPPPSSGATIY